MEKKDLLQLLDNVVEGGETESLNKHDRVLLIDGLNLFFRNFAMLKFINDEGVHVGGLGGFLRSLGSLINYINPTSVYVIFDGVGSTVNRRNLLPEYKENRNITRITNWEVFDNLEEENQSKVDQITRLIHYVQCLPVKTISLNKLEADDIIAHLSFKLSTDYNSRVFIVSSDKDFLQLVNKNIAVYRPIEREVFLPKAVLEKYGVLASNFILYKVLLGDSSDKVGGVKGLGDKKLLKYFPELAQRPLTLDDIFDICKPKIKEHVIYSRILFEENNLRRNYKVMDLHNPMIDDNEKQILKELVEKNTPKLESQLFLKYYHEDGLRNLVNKNIEYWLQSTFKHLTSYNQ